MGLWLRVRSYGRDGCSRLVHKDAGDQEPFRSHPGKPWLSQTAFPYFCLLAASNFYLRLHFSNSSVDPAHLEILGK